MIINLLVYLIIAFIAYIILEKVNQEDDTNSLYAIMWPFTLAALSFAFIFISVFFIPAGIAWLFKQIADLLLLKLKI